MLIKPSRMMLTKPQAILFTSVCLMLASVFSGYIATGSYMRLSGDDYCYNAVEVEHGFWQAQVYSYLHETAFGGNRFSLNIASSLSSLVGIISSSILPSLVLLFWLVGVYLAVQETTWLLTPDPGSKCRLQALEIILIAESITFYSLYMAPSLGQSLYWRSALLTYLLPMTFFTYVTTFFLRNMRIHQQVWLAWIALMTLAFLGAGFSETVSALQLGFYGLVFVIVLIAAVWRRPGYQYILKPLSAVLAGTLLAMLILVLSPANILRQQSLPSPPGFLNLILMSLENSFVFYKISLYKQLFPNVLCGLVFIAIACIFYLRQPKKSGLGYSSYRIDRFIIKFASILVVGYLLVLCCMAPSAYGESSYPDLRALIVPRWVMVVQIASLGWLTGWMLSQWFNTHFRTVQFARIAAMTLILATGFLALLTTRNIYAQLPQYQRWATYWDMRNAQILQAKQENQTVVHVMEIDHIIPDVSELKADPFFWYNVCAARYYGLQRIYANLPGWNK
jgi:hypothetical protein